MSDTQQAKKPNRYGTKPSPNFPGRGAIKCGICGKPVLHHETNDYCGGLRGDDFTGSRRKR